MVNSHRESAPRSAASYGNQNPFQIKDWLKFYELVGGEEHTLGRVALSEVLVPPPFPESDETDDTPTETTAEFTAVDQAFLSTYGIAAGRIAIDHMLPSNYDMSIGEVGDPTGVEGGAYGEASFDGGGTSDDGGGE
jgi:hypothetical protein